VETECTAVAGDGRAEKKVSYYKKESHSTCFGGYVPPADVVTECRFCAPSDFRVVWSDCIGGTQTAAHELTLSGVGCIDSELFQKKRTDDAAALGARQCSKIDAKLGFNTFTVGLLFIFVGIALALSAAYVFYKRHADLSVRYQRLSTNVGGSLEMADYDAQSDDDDDDSEVPRGGANGTINPHDTIASSATHQQKQQQQQLDGKGNAPSTSTADHSTNVHHQSRAEDE